MGMLVPRGLPRVIRRVLYWDKANRAKRAVDVRTRVMIERVRARDQHYCAASKCVYSAARVIPAGTTYAKVFANEGQPKIIRGRAIYSPRDYHFDCVPEAYRPLVRFLHPVPVSRNPKPIS